MTVVTVCGDPGGAKAIGPVLQLLEKELQVETINFAYNEATAVLEYYAIKSLSLPSQINITWISEFLQTSKPSLLLTATSHNDLNWEKFFISVARKLDIYSLAILDFWSNYAERFSDKEGDLVYIPDKIAVMDERAKEEIIAAGIFSERIIITGQPAFDTLISYYKNFTAAKKLATRTELFVKENALLVIFVSQPLQKLYGKPNNPDYLGYDEHTVLRTIIHSLEIISKNNNKAITLLIRPHPRETIAEYSQYQSNSIKIMVSMHGDGRDYLMSSDLVVGMTSVLLVEACYLHCLVMSVQPGLINRDVLPTNTLGVSVGVYQEKNIAETVEKLLLNDVMRHSLLEKMSTFTHHSNASQNIVNYICSIIYASQDYGEQKCKH